MHEEKVTTVNPYLTFTGNCREAMTFYKEALGGELDVMTFEGAPVDVPEEHKNNVMHASLKFGDALIMASDSMPEQQVNNGNSVYISIASSDVEEGRRFFNNLSDGGTILMPFEKTFWGAIFGMFTDKYGMNWMINCQLQEE